MSVDEQKQHILALFSTALRASDQRGDTSLQQLSMGMAQLLNQADMSAPVPLDPLMAFMLDAGLSERACKDIIVFFQNKTATTGVSFLLPEPLALLGEPVRVEIIDRMSRNTTDAVQAKIDRPPARNTTPAKKTTKKSYPKEGVRKGPSTGLLVAFALTLVAAASTYYFVLKPSPDAPVKLKLAPEQNFVGCDVIQTKGVMAVCVVGEEAAKKRDATQFKRDAEMTVGALKELGFSDAQIISPDGRHFP